LGRYGDIARFAGFTDSRDDGEGARLLAAKVRELEQAVAQPMSIAAFGIDLADFRELLPKLVEYAEQDTQFFTAPRIPESEELAQMFEYVYEGKPIDF
jgi:alcohol dehydrogenase class IV